MKRAITIIACIAFVLVMGVSAFASGWETHSFSGEWYSITRNCSFASLTATYSDAFKSLESGNYYNSNSYLKSVSITFPTTATRTVTAYVSVGGGTLGIAS